MSRLWSSTHASNVGEIDVRNMLHLTGAVADLLHRHPQLVEQRQLQIGERRVFGTADVTTALELTAATAGQQDRQVGMQMLVAIADSGSIQHNHVIEERAIAVW